MTSTASLLQNPLFSETDTAGSPLAGGHVYTYQAGTLIPLSTYTDATLTVPNTNPVVLDAYGKAEIWLSPSAYKINVTDAQGVQHPGYPVDNLETSSASGAATALASLASPAAGQGASLVSFNPSPTAGTGLYSVVHTFHDPASDGLNTFLGVSAGNFTLSAGGGATTLASRNTAFGNGAMNGLTTGYSNTAMGRGALLVNTTGYENTAIGSGAMSANTTGTRNTAVGVSALASNTVGDHNIAFGENALVSNTTGIYNTALGIDSMHDSVSGNYNVAIGQNALLNHISGDYNTAVGIDSLKVCASGYNNTALGNGSLYRLTSGFYNVSVGLYALQNCTTHVANTAVGQWAGYTNDGNYNVFIGYCAGYYETGSNKLIIDNTQRANEADARIKALIYGIFNADPLLQSLIFNGNVGFNGMKFLLKKAITDLAGATSFTYPANTEYQYISTPGASLATTLPATNGSINIDGLVITLVSASAIGTTTWVAGAGGAAIAGAPASMAANTPVRMIYHAVGGKWYPF